MMRIRHVLQFALIAVAISALFAFDASQTSSAREAGQRQAVQDADADLEEFRARIIDHNAELADAYALVIQAGGPTNVLDGLAHAQQVITELTAEELGTFRDATSRYPSWWDSPDIVRAAFEPVARSRGALGSTASLMSHVCPAGNSLASRILLENAALASEAINDAVNDGLTVVILGEGATVPSPVKIATAIAFWALKTTSIVAEQVNAANSECEVANDQAILHNVVGPRIDVTLSTRAEQATLILHDTDIKALIGGVQRTLDTTTEMKRIHLQSIRLGERSFLITADEAGVPVDVDFTAVQYSRNSPVSFVDVIANTTVTVVKPGVHLVEISPLRTSPNIDLAANIWYFEVKEDHVGPPAYTHFGITVFQEDPDLNLGSGQ